MCQQQMYISCLDNSECSFCKGSVGTIAAVQVVLEQGLEEKISM